MVDTVFQDGSQPFTATNDDSDPFGLMFEQHTILIMSLTQNRICTILSYVQYT